MFDNKAEQPLAAVPALPHVEMPHTAGVRFLVVGSDAVFLEQRTGARGQLVHPLRLQAAVGTSNNAVAASGKETGHDMPILIRADRQLNLVAVAVGSGGGQHLPHGDIQLAKARKGVPHKLRFGGALGLIADMAQPAAAAGAGNGAVLPDTVRAGCQQPLHTAEASASTSMCTG